MQDLARHQPRDGLQPDVRVGPDVDAPFDGHRRRPHVVGEAPRADRAVGAARERPPDRELADEAGAALEDLDGPRCRVPVRGDGRRIRGRHRSAHRRPRYPGDPVALPPPMRSRRSSRLALAVAVALAAAVMGWSPPLSSFRQSIDAWTDGVPESGEVVAPLGKVETAAHARPGDVQRRLARGASLFAVLAAGAAAAVALLRRRAAVVASRVPRRIAAATGALVRAPPRPLVTAPA